MSERSRFVTLHAEKLYTMVELCHKFGISTKTGYKWLKRFKEEGLEGLKERSRAPLNSPARTSKAVEDLIVAARQAHPTWGAKKLLPYLERRLADPSLPGAPLEIDPAIKGVALPQRSTAGEILKRRGLIPKERQPRTKRAHPGGQPLQAEGPNHVWNADFKGEFRTRDGVVCYPLTVTDAYSRFLLGCQCVYSTSADEAIEVFEKLFALYGLPYVLRTDNGSPFATPAIGGLSQLNVWWTKLGVIHQRITPGRPQENGSHERMHRTLKAETIRPPERTMKDQQAAFDRFRACFNEERPHEGLLMKTPAMVYQPSSKHLPAQVVDPIYPDYFQRRRVRLGGQVRFGSRMVFISTVLAREQVGLEEVDEKIWAVHFYDRVIGHFHEDVRTLA
jgi:putative transposase